MTTYSERLKDPRWQKKRLEVLEREGWECMSCGSKQKTLHVHHCVYSKGLDPWDYDHTLIALCEVCHTERGRLQTLLLASTRKMTNENMKALIEDLDRRFELGTCIPWR